MDHTYCKRYDCSFPSVASGHQSFFFLLECLEPPTASYLSLGVLLVDMVVMLHGSSNKNPKMTDNSVFLEGMALMAVQRSRSRNKIS